MIVNPAAGRGSGARLLPEIRAAFSEVSGASVRVTGAGGEEREMAARAIAAGFTTIVSVGGDGTSSAIANAIIRAEVDTRLAVVPAGTGNDFAKSLYWGKADLRAIARLATQHSVTRVDAGIIEDSYFLNSCGFGFDVAVIEAVSRVRWVRGRLAYVHGALRELFSYGGIDMALGNEPAVRHMMMVIANTPHFGGAFTIAPKASITDGKLDAISIRDVAPVRRVALLTAVTRGTHAGFREVSVARASRFDLRFDAPPSYQVDGELRQAASSALTIACVPGALRVLTGAGGLRQPVVQ